MVKKKKTRQEAAGEKEETGREERPHAAGEGPARQEGSAPERRPPERRPPGKKTAGKKAAQATKRVPAPGRPGAAPAPASTRRWKNAGSARRPAASRATRKGCPEKSSPLRKAWRSCSRKGRPSRRESSAASRTLPTPTRTKSGPVRFPRTTSLRNTSTRTDRSPEMTLFSRSFPLISRRSRGVCGSSPSNPREARAARWHAAGVAWFPESEA